MIDRRRIEICRALISRPRLILLDEPSAGMTHEETRELMDDILLVRERMAGLTIVIIEHEMGVIERITDRCVVLNYGRKISEGTFEEVARDPQVQEAYLGSAPDVAPAPRRRHRTDVYTAYDKADVLEGVSLSSRPAASPACSARTARARPR